MKSWGSLDNTIIFYCADNGASGEGSPNGSVNEGKFFNGWPDTIEDNLPLLDKLGTPDTYNHFPTGWAVAFSTPYRMFKRYTYQGGVCDPLVIHWPNGIAARGEVRHQYHHSTDIVPTILECCGVPVPEVRNGITQAPLSGVSMRYSFDAADAPTQKETQYYEMFGSRGIWHQGWKAVAEHGPMTGMSNFEQDRWQLFHTDEDRSEAHDLAEQQPKKVKQLIDLWFAEAEKNNVLPLNDLNVVGKDLPTFLDMEFKIPVPPSGQYTYYPGTSEVPERSAANVHAVSYKVLAEVEFTGDSQGVIFASGSRFGGHTLFVKDGTLTYAYNFLGIPPETRFSAPSPRSGTHIVGVNFTKERMGEHHEFLWAADAVHRRSGGSRGRAADDDRTLRAVRRGFVHRLRRRRRRERDVSAQVRVERRTHRQGGLRRGRRRVCRRRAASAGGSDARLGGLAPIAPGGLRPGVRMRWCAARAGGRSAERPPGVRPPVSRSRGPPG